MSKITRRGVLGTGAVGLAAAAVAPVVTAQADTSAISRMSLNDKVSVLFIQQVYGTNPTAADSRNQQLYGQARPVDVVSRMRYGGVIIVPEMGTFDGKAETVSRWTQALQQAYQRSTRLALQVTTTLNSGELNDLGIPVTNFPTPLAEGAVQARLSGWGYLDSPYKELKALGINSYFGLSAELAEASADAAVLKRFGSTPEVVTGKLRLNLRGAQLSAQVPAGICGFPGTGEQGLVPFKELTWDTSIIQVGHAASSTLDPASPHASLSKRVVTEVLRGQLGYSGVVITEPLNTDAVRNAVGNNDAELAVRVLEAGADQVLMSANPRAAHAAIVAAVRSGRIPQAELDNKVRRVLSLKSRLQTGVNNPRAVGASYTREDASFLAKYAVTVTRNEGVLPLGAGAKIALVGHRGQFANQVAEALKAAGAQATVVAVDENPSSKNVTAARQAAASADATVFLSHGIAAQEGRLALLDALQEAASKLVFVATGTPYDLAERLAPAMVATFGDRPVMADPLAQVLLGKLAPAGKLPVKITGTGHAETFEVGTGLSW